ncbi:MAG: alpha/beta hydrolase family esterase [Candidatus Binataceae bacterium]
MRRMLPKPRTAAPNLRTIMARGAIAIALSAACVVAIAPRAHSAQAQTTPGDHQESLKFGSFDRTFIVHAPPAFDGKTKLPVVMMLHGAGGNGANAERETGWSGEADKEGFIAVYPEAMPGRPDEPSRFLTNPRLWNDGSGRGRLAPEVDDVGFLAAVIDHLEQSYAADPARIYVTGMSNGASMTFRAGIALANRVAAIAPVAGHLWMTDQQLTAPVPLLFIIGTADPLNPLRGGDIKLPWGNSEHREAVGKSLAEWRAMLGCADDARTVLDRNGIKELQWNKCTKGGEVLYYTVEGLGHVWPGGSSRLPERWVGKASNKLDATTVIWAFFKAHPKQQ